MVAGGLAVIPGQGTTTEEQNPSLLLPGFQGQVEQVFGSGWVGDLDAGAGAGYG